jgi:hypothetical protein
MISLLIEAGGSWDNWWSGTLRMRLKHACSAAPNGMAAVWRKRCEIFFAVQSVRRKFLVADSGLTSPGYL